MTEPFSNYVLFISYSYTLHYNIPYYYSCLLPLFISYFVARFSGADLLVNGHGIWCSNYELHNDSSDFLVLTVDEYQNYEITQSKFLSTFVVLACIFLAMDVAWILMVWGAASVGTPTQPGVRDDYLR